MKGRADETAVSSDIPGPGTAADAAAEAEACLRAWHRALEIHDWAAVDAGLGAGFLMIEHDRILDKAALLAMLVNSASHGRQRASLHGFRTVADGDVAWTTVQNDELWLANDGTQKPYSFLETAVFRRAGAGGAWLIERYHATRLGGQEIAAPAATGMTRSSRSAGQAQPSPALPQRPRRSKG